MNDELLRMMRARLLPPVDAEQRPTPTADDDPFEGAVDTVSMAEARAISAWVEDYGRAESIGDPWEPVNVEDSPDHDEYNAMIRRRGRFERAAYDAEKALGREPTRDELRAMWFKADEDPVEPDLSWLER